MDWNKLLNWRLLRGSHDFPGPDGGTCINEAAIVAAGFSYRTVEDVKDMPPCFSQPISAFFLIINDAMSDDQRHLLMPYVVRLAGTADTVEIEVIRAQYLAKAVADLTEQSSSRAKRAWARAARTCTEAATSAAKAVSALEIGMMAAEPKTIFWRDHVLPICDGVLAIGRQAPPIEPALVVERMEAVRGMAPQRA